jgi:hypothetical protein
MYIININYNNQSENTNRYKLNNTINNFYAIFLIFKIIFKLSNFGLIIKSTFITLCFH